MASSPQAWNNFVFHSQPSAYEKGSTKWAAATAKTFIGQANNGGLNAFLTNTWDLDAQEVVAALSWIGAKAAADQLSMVLRGLGRPLLPSSQEERWDALEQCWTDALDHIDVLSHAADNEVMLLLEAHVEAEQVFYLGLNAAGMSDAARYEEKPTTKAGRLAAHLRASLRSALISKPRR